jgi:hypothetical protein
MRTSVLALILIAGLAATPALSADAIASQAPAATAQPSSQPPPDPPPAQPPRIDVDIDTDSGGVWYTQPIWIALGVVALIVIVAMLVMAGRGGGTTIVRG